MRLVLLVLLCLGIISPVHSYKGKEGTSAARGFGEAQLVDYGQEVDAKSQRRAKYKKRERSNDRKRRRSNEAIMQAKDYITRTLGKPTTAPNHEFKEAFQLAARYKLHPQAAQLGLQIVARGLENEDGDPFVTYYNLSGYIKKAMKSSGSEALASSLASASTKLIENNDRIEFEAFYDSLEDACSANSDFVSMCRAQKESDLDNWEDVEDLGV